MSATLNALMGQGMPPEAPWVVFPYALYLSGSDVEGIMEPKRDEIIETLTQWAPEGTYNAGDVISREPVTVSGNNPEDLWQNIQQLYLTRSWGDGWPVTPTTTTTSTTPTETRDPTLPPTAEEIEAEHYWFPEFPRITAEKLWSMMQAEDKIMYGGMTWDNLFVIDVQSPEKFTQLHLPGSLNIPNSYYWVLDPREDPKPEEWDAYYNEQNTLERRLPSLPKDKLIIVYDTTADDEPASRMAKRLVEEFDLTRIL